MKLQRAYFFIVLSFIASWFSGCATAPVEQPPVVSATSLHALCDQNQIQMDFDSVSQVVTLTQGQMKAMALIGSSVVVIGQEKVTLSGPVRREDNVIVVPPDFRREVIDRFSGAAAVAPAVMKIKRIVVDAGHGGKDPGATGRTGTQEKKIVLDIAKRLQRVLENKGFEVRMTRETDQFITLERRSQIAAQFRADVFVSVHANSHPESSIDGVEIYTLRELTYQEKKDPVRMDNHDALFKKLDMQKNNMTVEQIVGDMLYKYKQWQSPALAEAVARKVSGEAKAEFRGNKTAYFSVLRNTLVPAVLVEVGFLTNAREERMLKTAAYRQTLAEGIAQGIGDYANR